jgi:3D-(3,5/4)-trihydroxycyclohexane-1,2-dione acylhydrolase (decyclizing)
MGDEMATTQEKLTLERTNRARVIAKAGSIEKALTAGSLPRMIDTTLSEALVLGLLRQGVSRFLCVIGHGSTDVGEVLRVYQEAGLVRACGVRSEIEASHAAAALRWVTGEKAAVVTSIGPGALQALAASIAPASDGLGVWYLLGDETTEDEGPNMQQIPGYEQNAFLRLFGTVGRAYSLHTPWALSTGLRRGQNAVDHPHRGGPFFLLMPLNTQPAVMKGFNLEELPDGMPPGLGAAADNGCYEQAAAVLSKARRVVVKVGGGARKAGKELIQFLELSDGAAVTSPLVSGVIPYDHPRNMTVGGSKGSLSGNYAMEEGDLLVAIGSRFVCQADSSRTGYPKVKQVININTDMDAATHYGKTIALVGDAARTLQKLNRVLRKKNGPPAKVDSAWMKACAGKKKAWERFKQQRYRKTTLFDTAWGEELLTQPAAIKTAADWAREKDDVVSFFDAGDVQANGFQIVEDDRLGRTFTETGASYMGFAASALLATALSQRDFYGLAFSGDGSFTMSPQILIDGVEHGAKGCILLFDNRRMAAITGLQYAQYGKGHATGDSVKVDYVGWAESIEGVAAFHGGRSLASLREALDRAKTHRGISLIHVPVYSGDDELGGMGVFGNWNVGNWCEETQKTRHEIGL